MLHEAPAPEGGIQGEIGGILVRIEDARSHAEKAIPRLREEGAEKALLDALKYAEEELAAAGKRLTQRTVFSTPKARLTA